MKPDGSCEFCHYEDCTCPCATCNPPEPTEERRLNIYPNEYSPIEEDNMEYPPSCSDRDSVDFGCTPELVAELRGATDTDQHQFESGAKRSCTKPAYHLFSKIAMERLAKTLAYGSQKYGAYNWEKGLPVSDCLNHAYEHIYEFLDGDRRTEPEIDHLGHAFCNLMFAIDMMTTQPERQTDLRPARLPPE
jgi:hypothetical protein